MSTAITQGRYKSFMDRSKEKKIEREEIERLMKEFGEKNVRRFALGEDDPQSKDVVKTKMPPQKNF